MSSICCEHLPFIKMCVSVNGPGSREESVCEDTTPAVKLVPIPVLAVGEPQHDISGVTGRDLVESQRGDVTPRLKRPLKFRFGYASG